MRPTVSEQLAGAARLLSEVVGPEIDDSYIADVLAGVVTTLELLAKGWTQVAAFLVWDIEATRRVLELVGVEEVPAVGDPLDVVALQDRHTRVRALLERAMPDIAALPEARTAVAALFRERADRYPIPTTPWRGPVADTTR